MSAILGIGQLYETCYNNYLLYNKFKHDYLKFGGQNQLTQKLIQTPTNAGTNPNLTKNKIKNKDILMTKHLFKKIKTF